MSEKNLDTNEANNICKSLSILRFAFVALSLVAIICGGLLVLNNSMIQSTLTDKNITVANKNITIAGHSHPYNECIKLLIDQVNKEGKECNFEQLKSVCFELLKEKELSQ